MMVARQHSSLFFVVAGLALAKGAVIQVGTILALSVASGSFRSSRFYS